MGMVEGFLLAEVVWRNLTRCVCILVEITCQSKAMSELEKFAAMTTVTGFTSAIVPGQSKAIM